MAGVHHSCGRSTSQHERCVIYRRVNKDSRRQNDKTMVKVDNEFKMNSDVERKTFLHRGLTTTVLAGSNTWALCVWCPRAAAPVYQRKGREDSTSSVRPVDRTNSAELVEQCPLTTRHKVKKCSDDCRSRVRSHRRVTNVSREENGLANQETSTADQGQKKYKLNDLEALGNKASPRERCPRGQRRRCLAQAVQAWMDLNETKKQPGKGPQNPRRQKSIPNSREKN